jgi:hypothetical protein
MSARGAVVSKTGPQNFEGSTGSAISPHRLYQIRPSTCHFEAATVSYPINGSKLHSVAAGQGYVSCTDKLSVRGPSTAILWVLKIRKCASRRLWIHVLTMLCTIFAPGGWLGAEKIKVRASEILVNRNLGLGLSVPFRVICLICFSKRLWNCVLSTFCSKENSNGSTGAEIFKVRASEIL